MADTADDLSPEDKERIAGKVRLFGIKVGQFGGRPPPETRCDLMQIADIADSYDRNRRVGMDRDEARGRRRTRTRIYGRKAQDGSGSLHCRRHWHGPRHGARAEANQNRMPRRRRMLPPAKMAAPEDVPESGRRDEPVRTTVAATVEAEQLAFDFDGMPTELDSRQNRGKIIAKRN